MAVDNSQLRVESYSRYTAGDIHYAPSTLSPKRSPNPQGETFGSQ